MMNNVMTPSMVELQGYDPEVVDLISLKPFDMEQISKSVAKTNKVIIVEECMKTGGIGASLSAVINESLFDHLDAPVKRLSSQDVPTAYAHELEAATIVQPADVADAVRGLCGAAAYV
jgi:pyruvate dehydrogenase E1 component beta subunit